VVAASGEEGLHAAVTRQPAAVVVDQHLPGINGPDVIRKLRADASLRRVACLLLTASEDQADELRALDAGADSFCQKTSGLPAILAKLAMLLRSAPESAQASGVRSLHAPKRILAVDDSATFLGELCDHLREEGYDVVAAYSGAEALELLESQPVDGILLDLQMPGLSGQETCRQIKANATWRDIPLIILTAMNERTGMVEGINAGADDYITKSGDFEILKARLRAQLRRKQFEDENREIRDQLHKRELHALEVQALRELTEAKESLIASLEKKNAELAKATQAAEELNKELESFSYSVSHDLRAPLRGIASFGQFLKEDCAGRLDEAAEGYLDRILAAAERMNQLIDDMLSLSRVNRSELRRTEIDLSALAREVVANLGAQGPNQVHVEIEDGLLLLGDRGLIRILLENLLGNAWKFTSKQRDPKIWVGRCPSPGDPPVVFVRDNGAGFDMRYAKKLFGVFQRLHREDEFPGTGVGLATAARIVHRHGGKIWAEGTPNAGATFYFSLSSEG
jgi:two-component system NtrC family sensor kinase